MTTTTKNRVRWISLFCTALFAAPALAGAQTGPNADVVAAITKMENGAVKADLAADSTFYQNVLAEGWTRGDTDGHFYTKPQIVKLMAAGKIKTNREKLSGLQVRVYGDTAVATYTDSYDIVIMGQDRVHTIIGTDTFAKIGGEWKQVASHGALLSK